MDALVPDLRNPEVGLNQLAAEIHQIAVEHGWYDSVRQLPECIALMHSELSEALEEHRRDRPMLYYPCNSGFMCDEGNCGSRPYDPVNPDAPCSARSAKPEGVAVELIDCIIRILDTCAHLGVDVEAILRLKMEYNRTRPYRHGGKKC